MLSLVLSLLAVAPAPALALSAGLTCAQEPATCDAAETEITPDRFALARTLPTDYATPAVIDCRVPVVTPVLLSLVGECDGATPLSSRAVMLTGASYRASRYPESERPSGTLGPRRRDATPKASLPTCTGLPAEGSVATPPSTVQPVALFAVPALPHLTFKPLGPPQTTLPPSRPLNPIERPPRA